MLKGTIYIIPNAFTILNENKKNMCYYEVEEVKGNQVCFEGRIINDENDNWGNHKYLGKEFKNNFPVSLFKGKKEGEIVEITILGKEVKLTCSAKFKSDETFEELLYFLSQSFRGVCDANEFTPPLSKANQKIMLINTHKEIADSYGFEVVDLKDFRYADSSFH